MYTLTKKNLCVCMKVLINSRVSMEHHHAAYSQFGGRSKWHTGRGSTKVLSYDLSSVEDILWYYQVSYLGFHFTIEWRCISTCRLNYDVRVITCFHNLRRSCRCSIFINPDECKFLIILPQYSYKEFDYVKRLPFSSGCKTKGVWSIRTYSHKGWGKYTDAFNIGKCRIHLKHEPRGEFRDINFHNSSNFRCLGKKESRSGLFQVRDMFWYTLHDYFSCH